MNTLLRHALSVVLALTSVAGAVALNLPVKRVNGVDQYYYAVRRGDTVYGLARQLGITRDQIVEYNPSAADGLRQGATLYFPVSVFGSPTDNAVAASDTGGPTFRYKVQRGETLFGLSHRFGVTPESIIALNPQSNDGIKAGEYLLIPGTTEPEESVANVPQPSSAPGHEGKVKPNVSPVADSTALKLEPAVASEEEHINVVDIESQTPTGTVAVLLPLMLDDDTQSKTALRASDFVKGLMLAAREMGADGSPVKIGVYDTKGSQAEIARIMSDSLVADADVIITPDDEASLMTILGKASPETYLFNILAVQDTTYRQHDNVLQANIPHEQMYEKAVDGLLETYEGYTPVFLISKGGRSEKLAFTQYARMRFEKLGLSSLEIAFDGMLQQRDLEALDPAGKYLFIPASGSLSEFNKFARTLLTARENVAQSESIALFGYPDWTIFRGDAADMLHSLGATFYSRFFINPNTMETAAFDTAFTNAFGSEPMSTVPSQALLGYDSARFIITNLRENAGVFSPEIPADFSGLQSTFHFVMPRPLEENHPDPDGQEYGAVNTALYLITYLPGNGVASRVL